MRTLKPLYVSPLVTPFDDGRRLHCVVTALVHVSFAGELLKDQELWFYANEETEAERGEKEARTHFEGILGPRGAR